METTKIAHPPVVSQEEWRKDYTSADYELSKPRDLGITASRGGKGRGG